MPEEYSLYEHQLQQHQNLQNPSHQLQSLLPVLSIQRVVQTEEVQLQPYLSHKKQLKSSLVQQLVFSFTWCFYHFFLSNCFCSLNKLISCLVALVMERLRYRVTMNWPHVCIFQHFDILGLYITSSVSLF